MLAAPVSSLGPPEPLLHRILKNLALAVSKKIRDNDEATSFTGDSYFLPIILRLLITWLTDCPNAVNCILDSPAHLTYLIELVLNPKTGIPVKALAAFVLGECVLYNNSSDISKDAFSVVDAISQKIGLTAFFLNFDGLKKMLHSLASSSSVQFRKQLTRSASASMVDEHEIDNEGTNQKQDHPILLAIFDPLFVNFIQKLEADVRERIAEVFSQTRNKVTVVPAELEQKGGETDADYISRLKSFVEKQCHEMQVCLVHVLLMDFCYDFE